MRKKLLDYMIIRFGILWCMAVLLLAMFPAKAILAGQEGMDCPPLAGVQGVDNRSLSETHPTEICKLLTNKTASEKAHIKSREIARRDLKGEYTNTQYGVKVEIIGEVKEININGQSGIELFAKACRGDKQLGFGKDGSVEIERFRIFNPPILVDDPNGDIVREWTDSETGELKQRKLKEYPQEAIRQSLAHTIKIVGKENNNITVGKVGNTTSTFYPDADPETISVDGYCNKNNSTTWSDTRDATASTSSDDSGIGLVVRTGFISPYYFIIRSFLLFDTSSLPDSDTITTATLSLYLYGTADGQNHDNTTMEIVQTNPDSNTTITNNDFNNLTFTSGGSRTLGDFIGAGNANQYKDITLNSTGRGWISKTSITKLGLITGLDLSNTAPSGNQNNVNEISSADTIGTSQDPKLVVVHSAPTPTPTPTPSDSTAVIQPGSEGKDTCYGTVYATSGQPDAETLYMGGWGDWYYDFFEFDLTGSPSADETISATLYLYGSAPSDGSDPGFQMNRITQSWTESGVTLSNNPSSVFYKNFGSFSKADAWNSVDITDLYKSWKNGTYPNYGIKLVPTNNNHSNGSIYSSDNTNSSYRPKIVVSKSSSGTPTPTPSSSPTPTPTDTTAPSGSVSINSGASYTNSTTVTVTLSATDTVGVTGYYLSTNLSTPIASASGWNSVTSTTSYSGSASYPLTSGDENKTIYAWFKDAAGNVSNTVSDSIILDTTAPIVTITSPTSSVTYTATSNTVSLSGSASDSSSGISSVAWSNDRGGNGTATGTASWTVSSINLSSGDNVITVTATDNAGNPGTDIITVTVPPPTPTSTPTPTPTPQTSPTPATTPVPTPTTAQKGVIVGTVADGAAGVGIAGATITSDKGGYSATTGVDGSYTIVDVSAGDYTLTASADGYKSSSQTVTVYAGEATVADFLLKRASEGIVFGFVIDEDSNPLKGVTVTITINNSSGSTETDDDGYYEFRDLEAGGYTLTFEKSSYRTQTLDIILKAGEALEAETITMELEVKGSIFGYVVDISGNPIESVKLKLKGIKTKIKRNASSDADGFFEFADLDADKYVVFASKKRYKKTKQTVSLDEGDDQKIEIEMRKSSSSRSVIPETEE